MLAQQQPCWHNNNLVGLGVLTFEDVENKSKVIVTCRNWQILKDLPCEWLEDKIMDIRYLEKEQAMKLFSLHAFGGARNVRDGFEMFPMRL